MAGRANIRRRTVTEGTQQAGCFETGVNQARVKLLDAYRR